MDILYMDISLLLGIWNNNGYFNGFMMIYLGKL